MEHPAWICLNGAVMPPEEARISVFDRGFLHGDSVYEVLRTHKGRPLFWPEHRDRLVESAERLGFDLSSSLLEMLRAEMDAALEQATWGESYIRLVVTRGEGPLSLDPEGAGPPNRIIYVKPMPRVSAEVLAQGARLARYRTGRRDEGGLDPRAKSGNRLIAVMALKHALSVGADESLRVDPLGRVLEGGTSTFFAVCQSEAGPTLLTPPLKVGILEGITRRKVIAVAQAQGLTVQEITLSEDELGGCDEIFITSSVRGVVPVRAIDELTYRAPGAITAAIMEGYGQLMEDSVAEDGVAEDSVAEDSVADPDHADGV